MNKIVLGDSRNPSSYPDSEFHLTVTSPPYFVGKNYEKDYTFADYKELLQQVFHETALRTVPGGKIAINIADIAAFSKVSGRVEENIEVSRNLVEWLKEDDCHLLSRIVWVKDPPWINSQHVSFNDNVPATYVRVLPTWEYIWVFYKGDSPKRPDLAVLNEGTEYERVTSIEDTISKEDWKRWVTGVWDIPSVRTNKEHEAMFPEELVRRLVLLYSIPGDVIFDPFMGSGTTAVVSYKNGRKYAGIERESAYYELSLKALAAVENCPESQSKPYIRPDKYKQNKAFN